MEHVFVLMDIMEQAVCLYAQMEHMGSTVMRLANVRIMHYALILTDFVLALLVGKANTVIQFVPMVCMERNALRSADVLMVVTVITSMGLALV
jgi:hypothetical protein